MPIKTPELGGVNKITGIVLVAWTIFIGSTLLVTIHDEKMEMEEIAFDSARSYFRQLVIERQWNANHGGVYVVINKKNQPNPYLEDPLRDITTDTGVKLTKINPPHMTRQIAEIAALSNGTQYHITSLKPIRPANKPADWEARWLTLFEKGVREKGEFVKNIAGHDFRYMAPLFVSESCLQCHAKQGYRVGDIRGGISITLPQFSAIDIWHALPGFLVTFAAGILVILLAGWQVSKKQRLVLATNEALRAEIDERRKTEARVKMLARFPAENPNPVLRVDRAGAIQYANLPSATLLDGEMRSAQKNRLADKYCAIVSRTLSTNRPEYLDLTFNHTTFTLTFTPVIEDGYVNIYGLDITKRKQATEAILKEQARAQKYLDIAGVMFCALNTAGEITLINQQGCRILNIDEKDAIGKNWFDHFLPKPIVTEMKEVFSTLMAGKITPVEFYENEIETSDGIKRMIAFHSTILHDDHGNIAGVLFSGEDITEQKRAEEEKKKLEEQLRQAYKMEAIGTMAGGIAHDFNNILAIILGNSEIALEELPEEHVARSELKIIQKAAFRAKDLVSQILSFSRKSDIYVRPIKLASIIPEITKMLRSTIPTSIDIKEAIDPDCGAILGDPTQIHQIIINLCTNAVQAMGEKGTLKISLNKTALDRKDLPPDRTDLQPGPYIKLSISDTGAGIAAEISDNIFDPFFTTKDIGEGTGMGLSVIHGIVMAHHGLINFESEPGMGTIFHVYFAMTETDDYEPDRHPHIQQGGNERILLVDDEEMVTEMGGRMLRQLGYQVTDSNDSRAALELFRGDPSAFDLVITDYAMPEITGVELSRELLAIRPSLPIILCTGYTSSYSEEEILAAGIKKFFMKPYDRESLSHAVRQALDNGEEQP